MVYSLLKPRGKLPTNSSFVQGWIFELKIITLFNISVGQRLTLKFRGAPPLLDSMILCIRSIETYSDNQTFSIDRVGNVMYVPLKWNQGCFDAVYYWKEGDIPCFAFISCTIAPTHDYKLQFVASFLEKLYPLTDGLSTRGAPMTESILQLHFWTVVRDDVYESYRHGTVYDIESVLLFDPMFGNFQEDNPRTRVGRLESPNLLDSLSLGGLGISC